MDERTIISVEDEAAANKAAEVAAELPAFLNQWTMDDMPACPVGMKLLFACYKGDVNRWHMAEVRSFQLLPPPFSYDRRWRAYIEHRESCADCNESGTENFMHYKGVA